MKILFVYGFFSLGGVETSLKNRKRGLEAIGIECHLLFLAKENRNIFEGEKGIFFCSDASQVHKILRQYSYDVISVIDTPSFFKVLKQAGYSRLLLNECHTSNRRYRDYVRLFHLDGIVDGFIVPDHNGAKILEEVYGVVKPILILPNGIDRELFYLRNPGDKGNSCLPGINSGERLLCWVGRMEENKNPLEFIQLVHRLREKDDRITAWMIGGKTYSSLQVQEEISKSVEFLGLQRVVQWLPDVPYQYMPYIYSRAAATGGCLISTSRRECYPMIVLEAMACQCPVLCSDISGHREMVFHGENGFLYPCGDTNKGYMYAWQLLYDSGLRSRVVKNALAYVKKANDITKLAARLGKWIEMLGRKRK